MEKIKGFLFAVRHREILMTDLGLMRLKHVNNTFNTCFQDRKVNVSASRDVYFVKISAYLHLGCLLIFSILQILDDRFLVK